MGCARRLTGRMIAAVLFVNQKGEVIISRHYRDGFSKGVADTFRSQVIASKEVRRCAILASPARPSMRQRSMAETSRKQR